MRSVDAERVMVQMADALARAGDQIADSDDNELLAPIAAALAAYWEFRLTPNG